eukprot:2480694-Prymnesium_polylepis.1
MTTVPKSLIPQRGGGSVCGRVCERVSVNPVARDSSQDGIYTPRPSSQTAGASVAAARNRTRNADPAPRDACLKYDDATRGA